MLSSFTLPSDATPANWLRVPEWARLKLLGGDHAKKVMENVGQCLCRVFQKCRG